MVQPDEAAGAALPTDPARAVEEAWQLRHRDEARSSALAAEVLEGAAPDPQLALRARVVQAAVAFTHQDYQRTLGLARDALPQIRDDRWLGRLLLVLANVSAEIGEPVRATGFFNEAIQVARRVGDRQLVAQCLLNAALDHVDPGDQIRDFREALAIFTQIGDDEGQAYAHLDLAHALAAQMRHHEATTAARRAGDAAVRAGTEDVRAHARVMEALGSARLGHRLHAEVLAGEVVAQLQGARDPLVVDVSIELARVWSALAAPDRVVELLEPLTSAPLSGRQAIALTDLLSEGYAARGDHESAYWTLRSHVDTKDHHEDSMAQRRAAALVVLHHVQTVEEEAALAREREQLLVAEVSELRSEHRAVQEISIRDELTGLHNRRLLNDRLRRDLGEAGASHPVSLLLLDLDHFKAVNDCHGHLVGDQVLHELGRILRTEVRSSDVAARFGGEELAVLQPATDLTAATGLAERLRVRIREVDWRAVLGIRLQVTVSIGVATSRGGDAPRDLLRRADSALYAAKAAGRDRVVASPDAG
ncbi:GGDEF domain-containing protein [Arsenicicoccus sp. oral taxon 190]|uniref:GGDEF domain-containing protein n=1 Tax=Arsenicicoccus sp. oral taxon 190 TaxID=1658671 RepID=UPI00067B5407|nr:GGDEF domain-containing protein [Arsenicicoccus sp. oral taxon 190]